MSCLTSHADQTMVILLSTWREGVEKRPGVRQHKNK